MNFQVVIFTSLPPEDDSEETTLQPEGVMLLLDSKPIIIYVDSSTVDTEEVGPKYHQLFNGTPQGVLRYFVAILINFPHFVEMDPEQCETRGLLDDGDSHLL